MTTEENALLQYLEAHSKSTEPFENVFNDYKESEHYGEIKKILGYVVENGEFEGGQKLAEFLSKFHLVENEDIEDHKDKRRLENRVIKAIGHAALKDVSTIGDVADLIEEIFDDYRYYERKIGINFFLDVISELPGFADTVFKAKKFNQDDYGVLFKKIVYDMIQTHQPKELISNVLKAFLIKDYAGFECFEQVITESYDEKNPKIFESLIKSNEHGIAQDCNLMKLYKELAIKHPDLIEYTMKTMVRYTNNTWHVYDDIVYLIRDMINEDNDKMKKVLNALDDEYVEEKIYSIIDNTPHNKTPIKQNKIKEIVNIAIKINDCCPEKVRDVFDIFDGKYD